MKLPLFSALGFLTGALVGFAWAQKTKTALPGRVKTNVAGGIVTVEVDAKGAAIDGLGAFLNR